MKKTALLFLFVMVFANSKAQTSVYHASSGKLSTNYIIPVVVHVLHNYGSENISDAQVKDALRILNEDFQKRNTDTSDIVPAFKAIAADCQIEFRLATLDPNGACTNGIEHIATSKTYFASDSSKINQWPPSKYLNIWTVADFSGGSYSAYSTLPGGPSNMDGVIALNSYFGSIGTGNLISARGMTGVFGHYFNLYNTWGQGVCGDDSVSDTPPTSGFSGCNLTLSNCNPPAIENVQNFMSYSYCERMFTEGQKLRMHAALNSSISGRNNLWSPANLAAAGTADPYVEPLCKPACDFYTIQQYTCPGYSIKFIDLSWRGHPTNWNWSFPGGVPTLSTDSNPTVLYNSSGTYNVTLTVSNSAGADTKMKSAYILVMDSAKITPPVSEGFEGTIFPSAGNFVTTSISGYAWQLAVGAGTSGSTHSMMVNNYNSNQEGSITEYITPSFDFSKTIPSLTFYRAYSLRSDDTTKNDFLKIFYSLNCGQTWTLRYSKIGSKLVSASPRSATYFVPSASDWETDSVSVTVLKDKTDVRFKFQAFNGGGNNIYIDNININGVTGIENNKNWDEGFEIYPNPVSDILTINVNHLSGTATLEINNILGEKIFRSKITDTKSKIQIDVSSFTSGVYLITLSDGERVYRGKMVKN